MARSNGCIPGTVLLLAAQLCACDRAEAPPAATRPVTAPTEVVPGPRPSPRPAFLAEDLAARPAFHAAIEARVLRAPFAADVPQLRDAGAAYDALPPIHGGALRGVLLCRVELEPGRVWDPGRFRDSRTPADVTATVTLGDAGTATVPMRDDLDTPTFSIPDVELAEGDELTIRLVDRDFAVADAIGTVRLAVSASAALEAASGPATVRCRLLPRGDAEEGARSALAPLDEALVRLAARRVDLLADAAEAGDAFDALETSVRDAASYVGYADPIVQRALVRARPFVAGHDEAVVRAIDAAHARLPALGTEVRVGPTVTVRVASVVCHDAVAASPPACVVSLVETHRRIPDPPGFDAPVVVRMLRADASSVTCERSAGAPEASAFVRSTEPQDVRLDCARSSDATSDARARLLVIEHEGRRVLARAE